MQCFGVYQLCLSCLLYTLHNSGCQTSLFGVVFAAWTRHAVCHCDSCAELCETPESAGSSGGHPAFCGLDATVIATVAALAAAEQ